MKPLLVVCVFLQISILPNIAMPGFWDVGTGRKFVHFFREDSIYTGKIIMQEEIITIGLYRDFAVVKGIYKMQNITSQTIKLRTGFPIAGRSDNSLTPTVVFNELYGLKVLSNNDPVDVYPLGEYFKKNKTPYSATRPIDSVYKNVSGEYDNWYVWKNVFPPGETVITVYYITDNSNGRIRKGYNNDKANGFSYIIESGATWGQAIGKGTVTVHLLDDLSYDDITAISPSGSFFIDGGTILQRQFVNLHALPQDNLVIRYTPSKEGFAISTILSDSLKYFAAADSLSLQTIVPQNETLPAGSFEPASQLLDFSFSFLKYLGGALLIYFGVKYILRKKE